MADIQRAIARKRKRVTQGLPEWGKDLPDDVRGSSFLEACFDVVHSTVQFFERLELFREESIRKQEELIDKIRREVREGRRGREGVGREEGRDDMASLGS